MFSNKEQKLKIEELTSVNASVTAELEEAKLKLEELQDLKKMNSELQENMKKVNGINEELENKVKALEEEKENMPEKINDAALNIVSQMGHDPIEEPAKDEQEFTASVESQYQAIKDPAKKFEFFSQHKKQLLNAAFKK
jgi:predicted nuclease with TOPRIM domain